MKKRRGALVLFGVATLVAACGSSKSSATHHSSETTSRPAASSAVALAAAERTVCSLVFPSGVGDGNHCVVAHGKIAASTPTWVYGTVYLENAEGQPDSDIDQVIVNLRTHTVIGPTSVGFCQEGGPSPGAPLPGYDRVPSNALADFGLSPCSSSTTASSLASTTTIAPTATTAAPTTAEPTTAASSYAFLAGTWGAHETSLTLTGGGAGTITYADLGNCSTCSFADAPTATISFLLTSVSGGVATGHVTASSDQTNATVGEVVEAMLTAGSPGQILQVTIGTNNWMFCNASSAGQCGA